MTVSELSVEGLNRPLEVRRNPRARRISLRVAIDGTVTLTLPQRASLAAGMKFVEARKPWLLSALDQQPPKRPLLPGHFVPLDGEDYYIQWSEQHTRAPRLAGRDLLVGGPRDMVGHRLMRWLQERGRQQLRDDVAALASQHGLAVARVRVADPTTRWGSCSTTGVISFSWRLVMAPAWVRMYVVAHELAHLRHMDHSPAFWRQVVRLGGDLRARDWLRLNGPLLHVVG